MKAGKTGAQTSTSIEHHAKRQVPEGSGGVQNDVLEPSWAPRGAMWAQVGRQERPRSSLGGSRGSEKNHWAGPGGRQRRKISRFQGRKGSPEGSGGDSGEVFLKLFRSRGVGATKTF